MHVRCGEFECVFEALGFYWAGSAEFSGGWDVGDVFVVFGEHLVCFAGAVGLCSPVFGFWGLGCVCIVWICLVLVVLCVVVEWVCHWVFPCQ
jgi:hypothetical protein